MNENKINSEDQINLRAIKSFIIGLLQFYFRFISFVAFVIDRRKWLILIGFVIGAALGAYFAFNRSATFRPSMVVQSSKLTKKTYAEIINQLNQLATTSKENLGTELKLPGSIAAEIVSFDARNINDEALVSDTSSKFNQPFKITVSLTTNAHTLYIQEAVMNYLKSVPYLKRISDIDRQNGIERLQFINSDLAKLDTLKTEFNRFLANSKVSSTVYNNAIDPAAIYLQSNALMLQREQTQRFLGADIDAIVLIDGLKVVNATQPMSWYVFSVLIGGVGMVAGFLLGFMRELRKKVLP